MGVRDELLCGANACSYVTWWLPNSMAYNTWILNKRKRQPNLAKEIVSHPWVADHLTAIPLRGSQAAWLPSEPAGGIALA